MFALEETSTVTLRAEILRVGGQLAASQHRLVQLVRAFDRSGEWSFDGVPTCAHWIAGALDVEVSTAREWLRIGAALERLRVIDDAFEAGRLSYSKVRTLTRVATPDNEAELCDIAHRVPAGRLRRELATWQSGRETPDETEARQHAARALTFDVDVDGTIVGWFRLAPAEGALIRSAVDAQVRRREHHASADAWCSGTRWPSMAQQRADALVALARGEGENSVFEVVLHVRGDGCTLDDGTPIPSSVVERIAPEAFIRALIHDADGRPINASKRQRLPTKRQRRVVKERDRACVDCGSTEFLQYDHVPSFEQTHHTIVEETEPRCPTCHHLRHKRGTQLGREPN